jgi:hypothetical protein
MEEEKNGQKIVSRGATTCACGPGCTCGCGGGSRVLWWVIGIAVIIFTFAVGVKAGEFRDELRAAFGGYYGGNHMMMRSGGGYGGNFVSPAVPETPVGSSTGATGVPMIPAQTE